MSLLAAVFAFLILRSTTFHIAIIFYAVYFTLTDGFMAPVLSMLSLAAPADCKGSVMGYFITIVSIATLTMPLTVARLVKYDKTQEHFTFVLMLNCCIPNLLASICFTIASFHFKKEIDLQTKKKAEDVIKAIQRVPEIANSK